MITITLLVIVYFIPSIIAGVRNHPNDVAIFALNLFLGWTFLGWVGSLVWSLTAVAKKPTISQAEIDFKSKGEKL